MQSWIILCALTHLHAAAAAGKREIWKTSQFFSVILCGTQTHAYRCCIALGDRASWRAGMCDVNLTLSKLELKQSSWTHTYLFPCRVYLITCRGTCKHYKDVHAVLSLAIRCVALPVMTWSFRKLVFNFCKVTYFHLTHEKFFVIS